VSEILLRDWRLEDEPEVEELWRRVFGSPRGGQSIAWLFRSGPAGPPRRAVAELDGRVVAHAGVMALRFRVGGEQVRGAVSVAAMTAPEMQGRGLYARLGARLYERLEREDFAFVAGFSNARSHALMTGPLGRTPIRPLPLSVRLVLPRWRTRGEQDEAARHGLRVVASAPEDPRLDALWLRAAAGVPVGAVRDGAFAAWRYGTRPDADYQCWIAEGGPAREALAMLVLRVLPMGRVPVAFVMDLVVDPIAPAAGAALLRCAVRASRARGARALSALLPPAGAARRALRRAGFVRVPERLQPQVLRFSVRGLGRFAGHPDLADRRRWWLSWADTDVV
jgi:predicted N-acetyltransferase YhbS